MRRFFDLLEDEKPSHDSEDFYPENVTDDDVEWNLVGLGAPLAVDQTNQGKRLPPEVALGLGLHLSRKRPSLARTFPLLLAKHWAHLNRPRLCHVARKEGELQALGFYLDVAGLLTRRRTLGTFADKLLDHRRRKEELFFSTPENKYSRRLAQKRRNTLSRKWHFLLNLDMQAFRSLFEKFYG
ncbi:MAG TPA: hypothetical protein VI895_13060 [Bdellovibrionota bacterium]|nr:hypothetical protein [Bdellovibrionota bacterium]